MKVEESIAKLAEANVTNNGALISTHIKPTLSFLLQGLKNLETKLKKIEADKDDSEIKMLYANIKQCKDWISYLDSELKEIKSLLIENEERQTQKINTLKDREKQTQEIQKEFDFDGFYEKVTNG